MQQFTDAGTSHLFQFHKVKSSFCSIFLYDLYIEVFNKFIEVNTQNQVHFDIITHLKVRIYDGLKVRCRVRSQVNFLNEFQEISHNTGFTFIVCLLKFDKFLQPQIEI